MIFTLLFLLDKASTRLVFFFSSRGRHTRWPRDWSSDVCSSDLLDRLAMLIDHQWNWRQNQALARRLHTAKLRGNACVEEIDFRTARGLDKSVIRGLAQESGWYATTNTCSFSALQAWARA